MFYDLRNRILSAEHKVKHYIWRDIESLEDKFGTSKRELIFEETLKDLEGLEETPYYRKYNQVCYWTYTFTSKYTAKDFEDFMYNELGVRVEWLESIVTTDNENNFREDTVFAIHSDDIERLKRTNHMKGIEWIEDALNNYSYLPERLNLYCN